MPVIMTVVKTHTNTFAFVRVRLYVHILVCGMAE